MVYTKRLLSPEYYKVGKKIDKFIVTPSCGTHKKNRSIPLAIVMRNNLKVAENISEVKQIINQKIVMVDNRICKDFRFPLGFMDVISIGNSFYRVLVDKKGICIKPIEKSQAGIKLLKILMKRYTKQNRLQLGFHDGRTMFVDKDIYKTGDVVLFDLESRNIKELIQFKRGAVVLVIEGRNKGTVGKIEDFTVLRSSQPNRVSIKTGSEMIETLKDYVFLIGQESPIIDI